MNRQQYAHAPKVRTQADKLVEATSFVWCATDRVIADPKTTGASIALMKGVTSAKDIAAIAEALSQRRGGLQ